jgi:hypothetical protein
MACEQVLIQQLRQRGFRLTPQREIILSVLHDIDGLATVDEIYQEVQAISPSADLSTVCRTLDLLQELDLVSCVDAGEAQRRYELLGMRPGDRRRPGVPPSIWPALAGRVWLSGSPGSPVEPGHVPRLRSDGQRMRGLRGSACPP